MKGALNVVLGPDQLPKALTKIEKTVPSNCSKERRVFSDIDDTVCSGWVDFRYPKGTIYPGGTYFIQALRQTDTQHTTDGFGISFLTARPADGYGFMDATTRRTLQRTDLKCATMLYGDIYHLFPESRIATKKPQNFKEYARLYPEAQFTFVGDSGQQTADSRIPK